MELFLLLICSSSEGSSTITITISVSLPTALDYSVWRLISNYCVAIRNDCSAPSTKWSSCDDDDDPWLRCLCIAALLPKLSSRFTWTIFMKIECSAYAGFYITAVVCMMRHSRVSHIRRMVELTISRAPSGLACRSDGGAGCGRLDRSSDRICISCPVCEQW